MNKRYNSTTVHVPYKFNLEPDIDTGRCLLYKTAPTLCARRAESLREFGPSFCLFFQACLC